MPIGMERLEILGLLPGAREEHRPARHGGDRERRAAAGVAVELGEDEPGRVDLVHELAGLDDRVLSGHRVARHEDVDGLRDVADAARLLHHVGVDVQPSRRVDDHDVGPVRSRLLHAALRDLHGVAPLGPHGDADLAAQRAQLLDRGRALEVGAPRAAAVGPSFFRWSASFAHAVVFPEPCTPAIMTTAGAAPTAA